MITICLNQNINPIPPMVSAWIEALDKVFPEIEYQLYFSAYKPGDGHLAYLKYERIYSPIPHVRHVIFPTIDGAWDVKMIGDQVKVLEAIGFKELLESGELEPILSSDGKSLGRGYLKK